MIGEQFIRGWLDLPKKFLGPGQEDSLYYRESDFFRFFCCYLAFNHMYEGFDSRRRNGVNRPFLKATRRRFGFDAQVPTPMLQRKWKRGDREQIMCFAEYVIKESRRHAGGQSLAVLESSIKSDCIFLKPVFRQPNNGSNREEDALIKDILNEIHDETDAGRIGRLNIMLVLLRIYQVRCNLFHGDKDSSDDRDRLLVKDGADFLERFILLCIDDLHGNIPY